MRRSRRNRRNNRNRRILKLNDIVKTVDRLYVIKRLILKLFKDININTNELRKIKVRFGRNYEFDPDCTATLLLKKGHTEILLKRNLFVYSVIGEMTHEFGHEVTMFGKFGFIGKRRRNILGEISAYNFTKRFINKFNDVFRTKIIFNRSWTGLYSSPTHFISRILVDIPLGSLLSSKYKNK